MVVAESAVLVVRGEGSGADVPRAGRVLRVRYCAACGTWYGAYYPAETVAEEDGRRHTCDHCCRPCEFLDHWPNRHGECRAIACVGVVDAERGLRFRLGAAQQELAL